MNIAITLVIQGFVFFFVAWLVMKFLWPVLLVKIETRQKVIAEGLAAAAKSEKDLNEAEARSKEIIRAARERGANRRSGEQALERDDRGGQGHCLFRSATIDCRCARGSNPRNHACPR